MLEESFSAGKKVIYYDNEGLFNITDYVFNDSDFVAQNYVELERIVLEIVNDNRYSNAEKIKKLVFRVSQEYYRSFCFTFVTTYIATRFGTNQQRESNADRVKKATPKVFKEY